MLKWLASLLLISLVVAKDYLVVTEDQVPNDHAMVKAAVEKKLCAFEYTSPDGNMDQLCINYNGEATVGFKWEQDSKAANTAIRQGYYNASLKYYLNLDTQATPTFTLNRLFSSELLIDLNNMELSHVTNLFYSFYTNDICIDIYSQIGDIDLGLTLDLAFLECYTVLIDSINDFG